MLTQVTSNLLPGSRVALVSIRNNLQTALTQNASSLVKNSTAYKDKEAHNVILSLKSLDIFQTSNLTEG